MAYNPFKFASLELAAQLVKEHDGMRKLSHIECEAIERYAAFLYRDYKGTHTNIWVSWNEGDELTPIGFY